MLIYQTFGRKYSNRYGRDHGKTECLLIISDQLLMKFNNSMIISIGLMMSIE